MNTRNLTVVHLDGETKVAQYGQWDGYPEGQGANILQFLSDTNLEEFKEKVRRCSFLTNAEIDEVNTHCKELGSKWPKSFPPHLSRDAGGKILEMIYTSENGLKLADNYDFAADSLLCEFAYVVDFDNNTLECFRGNFDSALEEDERFFPLEAKAERGYHPVRCVVKYPLDSLPTVEKMKRDVCGKEASDDH